MPSINMSRPAVKKPAIDPKLFDMQNLTVKILLEKHNSRVPQMVKDATDRLTEVNFKIGADLTKTAGTKILYMAEMVNKEVTKIRTQLAEEQQTTKTLLNEVDKIVEKATGFKDQMDLMLCVRYADSLESGTSFVNLVSKNYDAARLVLRDPLTRHKFKITKGVEELARRTIKEKTLGTEGIKSYEAATEYHETVVSYFESTEKIVNAMARLTAPIKDTMVEVS